MTSTPTSAATSRGSDDPAPGAEPAGTSLWLDRVRPDRLLSGTVLLGLVGAVVLTITAVGAGGILSSDPVLADGPMSWIRYGHGRDLATGLLYVGFGLIVWAWIRLGRDVLAGRADARRVLFAGCAWLAPMLVSAPLFTRDVYSYLAQGALALHGMDPYEVGPSELDPGPVPDNVHYFWQTTPAPYGPLFILIAKIMYWATGEATIVGVIVMRLFLLTGLALLVYALPKLCGHLGGSTPVAFWLLVANPMTVVHLVGGPHNDLLMIGLLALAAMLMLQRRHAAGIAVATVAMAIKASGGAVLPFLVLIWAARLSGPWWLRMVKALAASVPIYLVLFTLIQLVSGVGLGWIPALEAPSLIINWISLPTGAGEIAHGIAWLFTDADKDDYIGVTRPIGIGILCLVVLRLWWRARDGQPDVVLRNCAFALFWIAVLAPPTLPWYLTWGLALGAAFWWSDRALALAAGASTWMVLVAYPNGELALYSWGYMVGVTAIAVLAGVSVLRIDPLRLVRRPRAPAPDPGTDGPADPPATAAPAPRDADVAAERA